MINNFLCRPSEVARVKVACRCGARWVAEITKQIADGVYHRMCTCKVLYSLQFVDGKWNIKRLETAREQADAHGYFEVRPVNKDEHKDTQKVIGRAVRISNAADSSLIGLAGVITQVVNVAGRVNPVIKLQTGQEVLGTECWWEFIPEQSTFRSH